MMVVMKLLRYWYCGFVGGRLLWKAQHKGCDMMQMSFNKLTSRIHGREELEVRMCDDFLGQQPALFRQRYFPPCGLIGWVMC